MLHLEFLVPPKPQKKSFLRSSKPRPVQTTPSILHSSIHLPSSPPRPTKSAKHTTPGRRVRFDLPPTPTTPSAPTQCLSPGPAPAPVKEYRDIPLESMKREQKVGGRHVFLPQYTPTPTLPQILAEIKMLESSHPHSSTDRLLISLVDQLSRTPSPNPPPSATPVNGKPCPACPTTPPATRSLEQQLLRIFTARAGLRYATTQLVTAFVRHGLLDEEVVHFEYDISDLEWEAEGWMRRILAGKGMKASCSIGGLEGLLGVEGSDGRKFAAGDAESLGRYDDHVRWLACVLARGGRKVGFRADKVLEVLEKFN